MSKQTLCIISPFKCRSGYSVHSRLILSAIFNTPEITDNYDIKLISTKWGSTPLTGIDLDNPMHQLWLQHEITELREQPDVSIQISIPSECQRIGKKSILISAGTEVNIAPLKFVEGCNIADMVMVPSQFTKDVLAGTKYDKKDQNGRIEHTLQVDKPLEVLFEGLDLEVFNKNNYVKDSPIVKQLDEIKEPFAYLCCGMWTQGELGQDRKDIGSVVKVFYDSFKNKKLRPALVLKVNGAGFSFPERDQIIEKINDIQEIVRSEGFSGKLPNVYLINGDLSDSEMNTLYNYPKIKALVSFTHAEGAGLPLLEFTATGKPIICSGYSGQMDFLNPDFTCLLPGQLTQIHRSASNEWLPKEGQWFTVNYAYAGQVMIDVFENYEKHLERSRKMVKYTKDNFSLEIMRVKFLEIWNKYITPEPKRIQLNLPQLKRIT